VAQVFEAKPLGFEKALNVFDPLEISPSKYDLAEHVGYFNRLSGST